MKAEDIQRLRTREPFVPFRLFIQDGRRFDVLRRDLILVMPNMLTIGTAIDPVTGLPEVTTHVLPDLVTQAEDLRHTTTQS